MIVDTHSHLNFKAYDKDREEVIKRNQSAGLVCVDVGTKYETSKNAIELAEKHENIYAAIGMHPIHIKTDLFKVKMDEDEGAFAPLGEELDIEKYKKLALSASRRVVAVGEIGLDYYYKPKGAEKKEKYKQKQKEVFIAQLEMAEELNLPVIVHCRMAFNDVYETLSKKKLRGVMHCFVGTLEEAKKITDLGFYIGINGIIDKLDLDEVVKNIPLDKILTETDCPYLTPLAAEKTQPKASHLGGLRNEPIFVKHVIQKIADLRGLTFDQVASATTANARALFKI